MIKLWFYNFEYYDQTEYPTFEAALAGARKAGFECTFIQDGQILGTWSPLCGFQAY